MRTEDQDDTPTYEVGQEQLDAVDRMLEELELDRFDQVERFEQHFQQSQSLAHDQEHPFYTMEQEEDSIHDHGGQSFENGLNVEGDNDSDANDSFDQDEMEEGDDAEPIGYIPLSQGENSDDEHDDHDDEHHNSSSTGDGYAEMQSDVEGDPRAKDEDTNDDGQGYDSYLRTPTRGGALPVPMIPQAIEIELGDNDPAAEKIPDEDAKTIARIMSSISLPTPDWAKSIPEERWMPKIVRRTEATTVAPSALSALSEPRSPDTSDPLPPPSS
ncbi:MAG: hypothetical protein J3Q66DRAFT_404064 [Benniella sp.]|nr:MAG: hypothetical protein J3Q66DRAFT_404064 [Benniella sp.]